MWWLMHSEGSVISSNKSAQVNCVTRKFLRNTSQNCFLTTSKFFSALHQLRCLLLVAESCFLWKALYLMVKSAAWRARQIGINHLVPLYGPSFFTFFLNVYQPCYIPILCWEVYNSEQKTWPSSHGPYNLGLQIHILYKLHTFRFPYI